MRRIPMISGDEFDAMTRFRHYRKWHAGQRATIKRRYRRRERREEKRMLLETMTADEAIRHGVTVKDYRTDEEKAQPLDVSQWQLSPWAKWVAADADGTVWEFDKKVTERLFAWIILDDIGKASYVGHINMAGIDWRQTLTAVNVGLHAQPQPWCEQCNLPGDICRGHDNDSAKPPTIVHAIVILWRQLDAVTECDLTAAMVRADEHAAEGFHMALGMALEAVRSPRYVGEDKERHARIWDRSISTRLSSDKKLVFDDVIA